MMETKAFKVPTPMKLTTVAAIVLFFVGVILASDIMVLGGVIILVMMSCTLEILEAIHEDNWSAQKKRKVDSKNKPSWRRFVDRNIRHRN